MAIEKQFSIMLDAKQPTSNRDFEVVEGDTGNVLCITLTDDGAPVDLTGCLVLVLFSKSDGRTAAQTNDGGGIALDTAQSNVLRVNLYRTSVAPGLVECELQVFSGQERKTLITSAKFNFLCRRAIVHSGTIAETEEWPLLTGLIKRVELVEEELTLCNEETTQAAAEANVAANRANGAAQNAEAAGEAISIAEAQRVINENARLAQEQARTEAESARGAAEQARIGGEAQRTEAESIRDENEEAREENEEARIADENARRFAENIREERDEAFGVWEAYNAAKAYVPLNKVAYNGSSYLCIANTLGVAPPNETYWLLIAKKGADGIGAGDMLKAVYDANGNGIVDNAERLGGNLPAAFAPAAHAHGNITAAGAIGTSSDKAIYTGASGVLQAGTLPIASGGTGATTAAQARANLGAAAPPVTVEKTLTATWANNRQTISDAAIKSASTPGDLAIAQSATQAQYQAWMALQPHVVEQAAGSITLTYYGKVNTLAIPLVLEVRA